MAAGEKALSELTLVTSLDESDYGIGLADITGTLTTVRFQWSTLIALLGSFNMAGASKTISSGEITINPGENFIEVNAESGTADDLTTITAGTGLPEGEIIILYAASGDTITYGTYTITSTVFVWLRWTGSAWTVINRYRTTRTRQLWVGGWQPTLTNGCNAGGQLELSTGAVVDYLEFPDGSDTYAYAYVVMPDDWDGGTFTAKFYWTHPATTTNFGVRWGLQAVAVGNDDALNTAYGTMQYSTDTGGTTSDLYVTGATSAITAGGTPVGGELLQLRVMRDGDNAGDTLAVGAYLVGVLIDYTAAA